MTPEERKAKLDTMCPHCGALVEVKDGLTIYHSWPLPTRQVCPGSKQNARCAISDHRRLWNGERNPHIKEATDD